LQLELQIDVIVIQILAPRQKRDKKVDVTVLRIKPVSQHRTENTGPKTRGQKHWAKNTGPLHTIALAGAPDRLVIKQRHSFHTPCLADPPRRDEPDTRTRADAHES